MEKITTYELLKAFKKRMVSIILITLGFGIIGGVYGKFIRDEKYTAQTVMIIVGNDKEEVSYNKLILNEKLANIYSQILTSDNIYKDVIEKLKLENISPKELKSSMKTEVNSQAGIISLELTSKNKDMAVDSLSAICEKFKEYVKNYLRTENLDYLQDVNAKNDSSKDSLKFGILGFVLGLLLSVLYVCIREVTSQKITEDQYIRDQGIDVLAKIKSNEKDEYRKIFAKISNKLEKGIIGISSTKSVSNSKVSYDLSKAMSELRKVLFVDLENDKSNEKEFANYNELINNQAEFLKDGKLYRLNFTKSDDLDILVETKSFKELIKNAKEEFDFIVINEKSLDKSQAYLTKDIEDGKILLVKEDITNKNDFNISIKEIEDLGFEFLGVIYNK